MPKQYTYKEIYSFIESKGCKLISTSYKNIKTKLDIQCKCGNHFSKTFTLFKHGKSYFCLECAKKQRIETNLKNFGVSNAAMSPKIKEKIKKTFNKNYGGHPRKLEETKEKYRLTCLEKYGVEHAFQSEVVKDKIKVTNIERYGVESPMQNPVSFQKQQVAQYAIKTLISPSGENIKYQGYEHFAYQLLLDEGYSEDKINIQPDITFSYYDEYERFHIYYPDGLVGETIIEVKSEWTLQLEPEKLLWKRASVQNHGYNFRLLVFSQKGKILRDEFYDKRTA